METNSLSRFWALMHSVIQHIWMITEPHIEEAAVRNNIPIELYYFSELGMDSFSLAEFQQRDPFSNPEQFEKQFARLEIKDWILPTREGGWYDVPEKARAAVRQIVQVGDEQLAKLELPPNLNLARLLSFLKQIAHASHEAPEPPQKWAIARRFRVATDNSAVIVQIREYLMDLLAYHDDAHLSAARPYFSEAGIVWSAFGCVWSGSAVTAERIAETLAFRGYDVEDYSAALKAAVEAGWLEAADAPGAYRPTSKGWEMHAQVDKLTDEYFFRPWAKFVPDKLDQLYDLLILLREQLQGVRKLI